MACNKGRGRGAGHPMSCSSKSGASGIDKHMRVWMAQLNLQREDCSSQAQHLSDFAYSFQQWMTNMFLSLLLRQKKMLHACDALEFSSATFGLPQLYSGNVSLQKRTFYIPHRPAMNLQNPAGYGTCTHTHARTRTRGEREGERERAKVEK